MLVLEKTREIAVLKSMGAGVPSIMKIFVAEGVIIGAVGTALLGIVLFAEPATLARLGCIGLIVAGIVGLKLVTPA